MDRLLLTLRFLATGIFFIVAGDNFGISKTAAHDLIQLVVGAIVGLRHEYIRFPQSLQEVRQKFYDIAHFPRVIGVIDCTHIRVQCPGKFLSKRAVQHFKIQTPPIRILKKRPV
uniref:Nuclease HARBI1 n=1 Tax=Cacopsylla melanoneura TaxID=428564 RepID=A0A8D8Z7A0_9HEMI